MDVLVGSVTCMIIVFFIIVCTAATLHAHGLTNITEAKDAALALVPLAGRWAGGLFAFGLLNASLFAAFRILPLSTAHVAPRRPGLRSRHRSQMEGSTHLLRPLHRPDRSRRRTNPDSRRPAL